MGKIVDDNGFWKIRDNPISKMGVFPYTGAMIGYPDLDPDAIYNVLRPIEELASPKTLDTLRDPLPFIDEHEMLGEEFTSTDERPPQGVLFGVHQDGNMLVGDIVIYSDELKDAIKSGKKELSLGYRCDYERRKGVFDGQPYDFVQVNLRGNHLALVERGRMGSDVRVYDCKDTKGGGKSRMCFDSIQTIKEIEQMKNGKKTGKALDAFKKIVSGLAVDEAVKEEIMKAHDESIAEAATITPPNGVVHITPELESDEKATGAGTDEEPDAEKKGEDEDVDKRQLIDEVGGILRGKVDDEIIRTIIRKMEEASYNRSSAGTGNDKDEDQKSKDEDPLKRKIRYMEMGDKSASKGTDGSPKGLSMDAMIKEIGRRNELANRLIPHIGTFAFDAMTFEDVAKYGCSKLGIKDYTNAVDALNGALAVKSSPVIYGIKAMGMDSEIGQDSAGDPYFDAYCQGKR